MGFHKVTDTGARVPRGARRKKHRPVLPAVFSLFLFLIGMIALVMGLIGDPVLAFGGVVALLSAGVIDRPRWLCGRCGNRVEKTSVQCPSCQVTLRK